MNQMTINEDRSAAKFCHQVAAWVPDMFCKFCSVKSHKIANKSATIEARVKIITNLGSLEFQNFGGVGLATFENNQILHNKISHSFQVKTKLFGR